MIEVEIDSRDRSGWPQRRREDRNSSAARVESGRVIGPSGAVRVMVATKPVDFRKCAEVLATLVLETMTADPFSGKAYVFRAKRADRIKRIFWEAPACACLPSGWRTASSAGQNPRTL